MSITHAHVATGTDSGSGEVHKAEWNAEHVISAMAGAGWTSFSPTIKAGSTTLTFPSMEAKYLDLGAAVYWYIDSAGCTSGGSGAISIQDLPSALSSADNSAVGFGEWADQGSAFYQIRVIPSGASSWSLYVYNDFNPLSLTVGTSPADSFSIAGFIAHNNETFDVPSVGSVIGASVYKASDLAMSTSGEQNLTLDSELFDTHGFHSTVTNNQRFTIPAGLDGKYRVTVHGRIDANTDAYIAGRKNGSSIVVLATNGRYTSSSFGTFSDSADVDLAANDYIEFKQLASSAANIVTSGGTQSWASIIRLDSGGGSGSTSPGYELEYQQVTSDVTISATAEGSATTIITADAVTFDGATTVNIEFYARYFGFNGTANAGDALNVWLFEDGSSIGTFANMAATAATDRGPCYGLVRRTPASGSRTYSVRATVTDSGRTGIVGGGTGGAAAGTPIILRITRV